MVKRIAALGVMLVMMFGFAGCGGGNVIGFNVALENTSSASRHNHALFTIVNSTEELETACNDRYTTEIDANNQIVPLDYYLREMTKNYDEAFFSDKALVLYLCSEPNGGNSIIINSLTIKDKVLTVNTTRFVPRGNSPAVMVYWTFIIEVNKSEITEITDIKINIKTKETN